MTDLTVWLSRTAFPTYSMFNPPCACRLGIYVFILILFASCAVLGTSTPQPDPLPMVTSQIMTPIFAQKFVKLQAPPHHHPVSGGIPPLLSTHPVTTPLRADAWAQALLSHPD